MDTIKQKRYFMCTAFHYRENGSYMGRNMDIEFPLEQKITITPRQYILRTKHQQPLNNHYAIIGMSTLVDDYPLYYDACNEYGLCMSALAFRDNAHYLPFNEERINLASYELIPYVLATSKNVKEALDLIGKVNLTAEQFNSDFPVSPLHFFVCDNDGSITVEPTPDGIRIYENPVGVLTNNPPFLSILDYLSNFISLSNKELSERTICNTNVKAQTRGLSAVGLPGDLTSPSRFVRASFIKSHIASNGTKKSEISSAFHILSAVEQQRGLVMVGTLLEYTAYSAVIDMQNASYHYRTYDGTCTKTISLREMNLDSDSLIAIDT